MNLDWLCFDSPPFVLYDANPVTMRHQLNLYSLARPLGFQALRPEDWPRLGAQSNLTE